MDAQGFIVFNQSQKRAKAKLKRVSQIITPAPHATKILPKIPENEQQKIKQEVSENKQKKALTSIEKLNDLVEESKKVLIKIQTANPFDLFPDQMIVDPFMIHVIHRQFFASEQLTTVPVKNVADITIETGWFFSTIRLINTYVHEEPIILKFVKREEALKLKRIIQGLRVCHEENIDLTTMDLKQAIDKVEELGKSNREKSA